MSTRKQNEQQFSEWDDLPDGGRRYWYDRKGKVQGRARYVKIVDENERTISFVQEIFDDEGVLIERHKKFPQDSGHEALKGES